jgi:hypothetical protein
MATTNQTKQDETVVHYEQLENGVHYFRFTESSRRAIDQWIVKTEEITRDTPQDQIIHYFYDQVESGMQPASYAFRKSQAAMAPYPNRAKSRTVFLVNKGFFVALMETFINLMRSGDTDTVRFFDSEDREKAMEWLLSDER